MPIILDIRARREKRGWSQSELARRSGVPQPAISRLERIPELGGRKGIEFGVLEDLARTLGCSPRDLITMQRAMTTKQLKVANSKRRKRRSSRK
jgi:transcriptional regulator with XRE-family HTH domain